MGEVMKIEIEITEYKRLLKAELKLNMLECGGVDNWEGYGESLNPEEGKSYRDGCKEIDEAVTISDLASIAPTSYSECVPLRRKV